MLAGIVSASLRLKTLPSPALSATFRSPVASINVPSAASSSGESSSVALAGPLTALLPAVSVTFSLSVIGAPEKAEQ